VILKGVRLDLNVGDRLVARGRFRVIH